MTIPNAHPLRKVLSAVILQARRDVRTGMRRARGILKHRRRCVDQHHRITFPHVQAAHWVDTPATGHNSFENICEALGLDAQRARAEIMRGYDRTKLRRALMRQFSGSEYEFNEWLRCGCEGVQYARKTGMTVFQERT